MNSGEIFENKKLFIFLPHQDDEIAIWPIWQEISKAREIYIFCLTNGELQDSKIQNLRNVRNKELIKNLSKNGVKKENIFFVSNELPPNDQALHQFFMHILRSLNLILDKIEVPDLILTTAMEGGHPDHDVANFLVRVLAKRFLHKPVVLEFYLYSCSKRFFPFNFGRPAKFSEHVITLKFRRSVLLSTIKAILNYRSQRKTFYLLGPGFLARCLLQPKIFLKKMNLDNQNFERPENSIILYEWRGWTKFSEIQKELQKIQHN